MRKVLQPLTWCFDLVYDEASTVIEIHEHMSPRYNYELLTPRKWCYPPRNGLTCSITGKNFLGAQTGGRAGGIRLFTGTVPSGGFSP